MQWFVDFFYDYFVRICLIAIMVGLGLNLSLKDLIRVIVIPKAVTVGLVGQMILLPILAFTLAFIFQPDPYIAIGLILLAACPGGITSNGYTLVARGDVALSVTLTTISSFITVVSLPLFAYLAFSTFSESATTIDVPAKNMMLSLAQLTVIPIVCGMLVRAKFTAFADKIREPVRKLAFALLITVIVGNTIAGWETLKANFLEAGLIAGILCFSAMALGFSLAKIFKLPVEQIISITFEIGIQNLTVVITLASAIIGEPRYAAFALVYSLFVKIGPMSFLAYARKMLADAKRSTGENPAVAEKV